MNLWDIKNNHFLEIVPGQFSPAWSLAFSPNLHLLAVGQGREIFQVWDINTAKIVASFQGDKLYENINISGVMGLSDLKLS